MRWRLLILTCLLLCVTGVSAAQSRQYTIVLGFPFPPWDVGPLEGVNYDLLTAICSANTAMRCRIIDRPTSERVDSDAAGHPVIGSGLTSGRFDAWMGWFDTPQRKQLGAEFADAHSVFPPRKAAAHKADEFRRDFNCGLALIRQNGVMASLCASSTDPGGDPQCILDGPAPTVQCLADNAR